jgi:hypothetical protein
VRTQWGRLARYGGNLPPRQGATPEVSTVKRKRNGDPPNLNNELVLAEIGHPRLNSANRKLVG